MGFRRSFRVEGLNLEHFVAQAAEEGITLEHVERMGARSLEAIAPVGAMKSLAAMAENGGWRLTIGAPVGSALAAHRAKLRGALIVAAILLTALCLLAARMVWHIRIVDAGAYEADIRAAMEEWGIQAPTFRSRVDAGELRDMLEWRYPQAAWFECGWRGMTLEIRMVGGVPGKQEGTENGACDVVASQSGVVQSIVTRAGTPVVKVGDTVREGQVLIRGEEKTSAGELRQVAARGCVYARTWISTQVITPLRVVETYPSGRTHTSTTVECPWFPLWQSQPSGFAHADVSVKETPLGGFFLPLKVRWETHIEADYRSVRADFRSILEENEQAALRKLAEKAGGKEYLVDNWVNWSIIEDEKLLSVATGEMLVDIAQQQRSSGMAAPE